MLASFKTVKERSRCLVRLLCFVFAIGPVVSFVGAALVATSLPAERRVPRVKEHNAAVDAWTGPGGNAALFSGMSFAVSALPVDATLFPAALAEWRSGPDDTTNLGAGMERGSDVASFSDHVRYSVLTKRRTPFADGGLPGNWTAQQVRVRLQVLDLRGLDPVQLWNDTVVVAWADSRQRLDPSLPCPPESSPEGPGPDAACVSVFVLRAICYVVRVAGQRAATATLTLDREGGEGCAVLLPSARAQPEELTGALPQHGGALSRAGYSRIALRDIPVTWDWAAQAVSLSVRSSTDPWVVALRSTQGTLDFGASTWHKTLGGVGLFGLGVFCVASPFLVARCIGKKRPLSSSAPGGDRKGRREGGARGATAPSAGSESDSGSDEEGGSGAPRATRFVANPLRGGGARGLRGGRSEAPGDAGGGENAAGGGGGSSRGRGRGGLPTRGRPPDGAKRGGRGGSAGGGAKGRAGSDSDGSSDDDNPVLPALPKSEAEDKGACAAPAPFRINSSFRRPVIFNDPDAGAAGAGVGDGSAGAGGGVGGRSTLVRASAFAAPRSPPRVPMMAPEPPGGDDEVLELPPPVPAARDAPAAAPDGAALATLAEADEEEDAEEA